MKLTSTITLLGIIALSSASSLVAQSPGNIVRGYQFAFTFEESTGVAPVVDPESEEPVVDEYLVVARKNDRGERIGLMDGGDYMWSYTYAKVPPSGATLVMENETPPDQSEIPEEEREPYYVSQSFTMEFDSPFDGTFTYEVTDSDDNTGTASGTFELVRGPWEDIIQDADSGWASVEWYGNVYVIGYPWVYSEEEGWVYVDAENEDDMWQFNNGLGWTWSGESTFPWNYDSESGEWLYLVSDPDSEYAVYLIAGSGEPIFVFKDQ